MSQNIRNYCCKTKIIENSDLQGKKRLCIDVYSDFHPEFGIKFADYTFLKEILKNAKNEKKNAVIKDNKAYQTFMLVNYLFAIVNTLDKDVSVKFFIEMLFQSPPKSIAENVGYR